MKDAKFRSEYERIGPDMELAFTLAEARRKAKLTQAELAARMGTSQAAVARPNGPPLNAMPVPSALGR
jgi:DNA-binding transcriptional regulator YiaG